MERFGRLSGAQSTPGTLLVVDHIGTLEDPAFIAASVVALGQEFLNMVSLDN